MDIAAGRLSADRAKILLVDDNAATRRSLQLLLQAEGYDVRAYACGLSLLKDESSVNAACFVTDYQAGASSGLNLLQSLRDRGWHGPAILMTESINDGLAEHASTTGFDTILRKPLHQNALVEVVQRLITKGEG